MGIPLSARRITSLSDLLWLSSFSFFIPDFFFPAFFLTGLLASKFPAEINLNYLRAISARMQSGNKYKKQ